MRSNGLTAASYRPVADLNPRVADALLEELRQRDIAAYCQPVETPSMSGLDHLEYQVEVLVRLYVDATASEQAVELLAIQDPYLLEGNDDLAWAQIVAGYDTPTTADVAPWPVYEDVDPATEDDQAGTVVTAAQTDPWPTPSRSTGTATGTGAGTGTRAGAGDGGPPELEIEPFVPPQPPPLPRLSTADKLGWLGLLGGPLVLVIAAVFSLVLPSWVIMFAALGFIAGFVSLVVRMGNGEDRLDGPENGAQV